MIIGMIKAIRFSIGWQGKQIASSPRLWSLWTRGLARGVHTKEEPGFWTRRRAFVQVKRGSNIQLLSFSLVTDLTRPLRP
jgi:hypothetical protein